MCPCAGLREHVFCGPLGCVERLSKHSFPSHHHHAERKTSRKWNPRTPKVSGFARGERKTSRVQAVQREAAPSHLCLSFASILHSTSSFLSAQTRTSSDPQPISILMSEYAPKPGLASLPPELMRSVAAEAVCCSSSLELISSRRLLCAQPHLSRSLQHLLPHRAPPWCLGGSSCAVSDLPTPARLHSGPALGQGGS